jgi:hypothetical protein
MLGGDTPLWNSLNAELAWDREGANKAPADGVVVVRTADPQRGPTSRFLGGLYSGLGSVGVPAVGVEQTDAKHPATRAFAQAGLSSVDNVDTRVGRLATVLLLAGADAGQYGVKKSAEDGALPPWPTPSVEGG